MFDPYSQWLGISKEQRPITCYTLLGVDPKEKDHDTIVAAVNLRIQGVKAHESGPHGAVANRILKEIELAKVTLLDPIKRMAYNQRLSKKAPRDETVAEAETAEVVDDAEVVETDAEVVEESAKGKRKTDAPTGKKRSADRDEPRRKKEKEKPKSKMGLLLVLGGVAAIIVLGGGAVAAYLIFKDGQVSDRTQLAGFTPQQSSPQIPTPPTPPTSAKDTGASKPTPPTQPAAPPTTPAAPPTKATPTTIPADPPKVPPVPKAPEPKTKGPRLPVPDNAALAKAEAALKETWKAEYSRTRPEDRLALAGKFLQPGREDRKDPAGWYVLLREAKDLAMQAGKPRLAIEAIDEIDKWFAIDAVAMRVQALNSATKTDEFVVAAAYRTALNLIQQAYNNEEFESARRYIQAVEGPVQETKSPQLIKLVADQKADVEASAKEFAALAPAKVKLAENPNDPNANLQLGLYYAFFQAQWEYGLALIARGADQVLGELARRDLSNPTDVRQQIAIADGWWNRAPLQRERAQRHLVKRARMWYERAGPASKDTDRTYIISRIIEAQEKEYARIQRLKPGSYFGRDMENRTMLLREGGGTMRSEEAIERGLEWLSKHQAPNGSWSNDQFHKSGQCKCGDPGQKFDVAGTAFGMLPFLGAGNTHKTGKHAAIVGRGLAYLLSQQKPEGNFSGNAYENGLGVIVICELYGLTKDTRLRIPAQAAVNYIARAQFSDGSWGYSAGTKGDTSVCGWQFTALKAAAYAKLEVPQEAFDRLSGFLDKVADPSGLGYGYNTPGAGPSTSAVGILCREFLSWGPGHPGLVKSVDFLLRPEHYPTKEKISIYSVFYITQVAHHLGGHHWETWNSKVRDLLVDLQDKGDDPKHLHQKGSWSPRDDPYAKQGGRLMFTSLSLITLQSYYYHIPLYGYGPYTLLD